MQIVVVKGRSGERDRMWVTRSDGSSAQVPINMAHDLPHLVVESIFGLRFGFWGLIDAGAFTAEIEASHARDPKRVKDGRSGVLMGRARQSPLASDDPLVTEHEAELMAAKALTNIFRTPDGGPATAAELRVRLADASSVNAVVRAAVEDATDERVAEIRDGLAEYAAAWAHIPSGGRLHLTWPIGKPAVTAP